MTKKVLFVTIHVGANFGSVLQTFATGYIFQKMGVSAMLLDYRPPRVTYKRMLQKCISAPLLEVPIRLLIMPLVKFINEKIYMGFVKRNCHLTRPYYSISEIKRSLPDADYYVSGSDQVWNSTHNEGIDSVYYWSFVPDGKKIFAFSSSLGKEMLPQDEVDIILPLLNRYKAISVRERSAQWILSQLGIKNVVHLLDPTLLLDKEEWRRKFVKRRLVMKPYILVFIPYNTVSVEAVYDTARRIADKRSLEVVAFSWGLLKDKMADRTFRFASPEDFLSLFYYADCVISNSFHGTAFAVNMNRPLWVYEPSAFSTRLLSLLDLVGLQHRMLKDVINDSQIEEEIDYGNVNTILNVERKKALQFLKDAMDL